jgi:hypothetical protein
MAMMQSIQMWDNRKLCVLEGEPVSGFPNTFGYTFLCCAESEHLFSIVSIECGLRVCYGTTQSEAIEKCVDIFNTHNKHSHLQNYLRYTAEAYRAYLTYVWARAGMWAHSPTGILLQPHFTLFNHHHLEDV